MGIRGTSSIWASALLAAATLWLIPTASAAPGPPSPTFLPFFLTAVFILEGLTAVMMWQHYKADGDVRLLMLGCAYAWTAMIVLPYAVTFRGLVLADPSWFSASSTSWLWVIWHVGFPLLLGVALCPWPRRWEAARFVAMERRTSTSALALLLEIVALAGVTVIATMTPWLPMLERSNDYLQLTHAIGPEIIALNLAAVIMVAAGWWRAHPIERWVLLAVTAAAADSILSLMAQSRFTIGWYAGRGANLVASSALLLAVLVETDRLYRAMAAQHGSLRSQASTDPLTGVANRRGLEASGNALRNLALTTRTPLAAFQIDLDWFKAINDTHGHPTGDDVLVAVAQRLQKIGRAGDVIGRMGGEEFVLLAAGSDAVTADAIASRLLESMRQPTLTRSGALTVTASIGYAVLDDSESLDSLLARADAALYRAKRAGRDRAFASSLDDSPVQSGQAQGTRVDPRTRRRREQPGDGAP